MQLPSPSQSSLLAESKNSSGHELSARKKNQTKCKISEKLFDGSRKCRTKEFNHFMHYHLPIPIPTLFFFFFFLRLIHRYLHHKTNSGFTFSCLVTVSRSVNISQCHLIPTPSTDIDQHCILRAKTSREGDNIQSKFWNLK